MAKVSLILFCVLGTILCGFTEFGLCRNVKIIRMNLGDVRGYIGGNDKEIESLARFAVQQYNTKQNSLIEFVRVLNVKEQVVAGKIYHLTLEAMEAGKKNVYEAKVWVKPWMNFKELQEFKNVKLGLKTGP